ncbi:MAG: GNAT family N-acetyltransferase [Sphingomonadales bacterium]
MTEPFMDGTSFFLRPVCRDDYTDHYLGWINDQTVTRFLSRGIYPVTLEDQVEDFEALRNSTDDVEFCIVEKEDNRPVGLVGLHGFQWVYRSAEFRILIGDRRFWGKGIGTEAAQLLCAYGFETLNLNKVWLGVSAGNKGAVRSYEKAGFTQEGALRQEIYRNGRYYDVVRMSLLRSEYEVVSKTWPIHDLIDRQFRASD